ncbi:MAG: deoxyribose-phosphate aldolase [Anaerovoracaceae bacterium]|jgi:deoxyribose-phosphate aldolase
MKFSKYFDHTLLKPEATEEDIKKLCAEAEKYDFASVCVNSCYARLAADELRGSGVSVCCVAGFPLGAASSDAKAFEALRACEDGASEIDMVINVGALKEGNVDYVRSEIAAARAVTEEHRALLKVIIETCLLTDDEKREACRAAAEAGADFVKTSTGFSTGGATEKDVRLMAEAAGPGVKVKASGGIRTYEAARAMIDAGASRLGTSAAIRIMEEGMEHGVL